MNFAEKQQQLEELARQEQAAARVVQEDYAQSGILRVFTRRWRFRKNYRALSKERDKFREVNNALFAAFISMVRQRNLGESSVPLAYLLTYFCFVSPRWFDLLSSETFPPALDAWYKPEEDSTSVAELCETAKAGGIMAEHHAGCLPMLLFNAKRLQERNPDLIAMSNSVDVQAMLTRMEGAEFPEEVISFVVRRIEESQTG